VLWSSESYVYGGSGTPTLETKDNWGIPGHAAVALGPAPAGGVRDRAAGVGEETEEAETRRDALDERQAADRGE
jgi:hypothetical protein